MWFKVFLRFFWTAGTAFLVSALCLLDNCAPLRPYLAQASELGREAWFRKEISFSGLSRLNADELFSRLPLERSTVWWLLNSGSVAAALQQDRYVAGARVESCSRYVLPQWGCFKISVAEREPRFVALAGDKAWVLGDDGSFIASASRAEDVMRAFETPGRACLHPPLVVRGLFGAEASPDLVRARFGYVDSAVRLIEKESGIRPRAVDVEADSELVVSFDGLPFKARLEYPDADQQRLAEQARRLKRLIGELGPQGGGVKEIDLAYNKIAVAR